MPLSTVGDCMDISQLSHREHIIRDILVGHQTYAVDIEKEIRQ